MAEFCLECFKKIEPNANEYNTVLSTNYDLCEGCGEMKHIVIEFYPDVKKPMQVYSIQDDFCGVPCDFMEDIINSQAETIKRQSAEIERLREIRDLCNTTILEEKEQIEKLKISDASKEECTIKQHGEIKELKAEKEVMQHYIDHLQAENERLQDCIDEQDIEISRLYKRIDKAKSEARKEFAERLKTEIDNKDGHIEEDYALRGSWDKKYFYDSEVEDMLDNLLKEMESKNNV